MATVVDFAAGVPSAAQIKAAGHVGAVRYISPPRPGTESWMVGKPAAATELRALRDAGLGVAAVWQFGKERQPDVMRGAVGGELDARAADAYLTQVGMAGWPVFFAVDFDITLAQWNSTAAHYFRAAVKVLGRDRVGLYGHSRVCDWAREDGLVADLGGGKHLLWQTRSWSAGVIHPGAVLYQRVVDTAASPGPLVGGVRVDVNDVRHDYWGQRPPGGNQPAPAPAAPPTTGKEGKYMEPNPGWRGDPVWLPDVLRLWGVTVKERPGWLNRGHGDFTDIQGFMLHHTGSPHTPDRTSPDYVADNPGVGGGLSANMFGHRSGVIELLGAGIAYHAGEAAPGAGGAAGQGYVTRPTASGPRQFASGNARYLAVEPQNSGREPWEPALYDALVRTGAAITWFLGHPPTRAHLPGHKEYAPGRKTDPSFDMDKYREDVARLRANPPFNEEAFMALTDDQQRELLELTRSNAARIEFIEDQIAGPEQHKLAEKDRNPNGGRGWRVLGSNAAGLWLTLVDAVGALRRDVAEGNRLLRELVAELKGGK